MKMSELLRRKILEAPSGGLLNKLKINKRRDILFFSDIFTDYVRKCEDAGYGEEMLNIGRQWMILYFTELVPASIKKLPLFVLSKVMKNVWVDGGLMDDFCISEKDGLIEIRTENEAVTSVAGENQFSVGLFTGICNVLFASEVKVICVSQSKTSNKYTFKKDSARYPQFKYKRRHVYINLNKITSTDGLTLTDALKSGVFQLKKNRIYFRGKPLHPVENTLLHLLGQKKLLFEKVPEMSYAFFRGVIDEASSSQRKLSLLKTLLQAMGWGSINIVIKKDIVLEIINPPYGIQKEKDNWNFITSAILGYLWLVDRDLNIKKIVESRRCVRVVYEIVPRTSRYKANRQNVKHDFKGLHAS